MLYGDLGDVKMMAARQTNSTAPSVENSDGSEVVPKMEYPLHECVYKGKIKKIPHLLRQHDIDGKDKHGEFLSQKKWISLIDIGLTLYV